MYPLEITRGTGPLSQMIQAKLGWGAIVKEIAEVDPPIQTPPETDVEVRLESGRIAKVSRLKLSCHMGRGPNDTYTSCTFTGAITGTRSKFE
jgi:hypothetical protein